MNKADLSTLSERLNGLAEVFERKPVGGRALEAWFDVLREFPIDRVCRVLTYWPKKQAKFPAPSDVWKHANEIGIEERDAKARVEIAQNREESIPRPATPVGKSVLAALKAGLGRHHTRGDIAARWIELRDSEASLPYVRACAVEALHNLGHRGVIIPDGARAGSAAEPIPEREPGQDDEERDGFPDYSAA